MPLKAKRINPDGIQAPDVERELEQLAKDWLQDDSEPVSALFIQGSPGRGKSMFCRMFADWVREHESSNWIPILICLRDISLENDFEETLRKSVKRWDFANDHRWLSSNNRFLFILDGFDELPTSVGLEEFLKQVDQFQQRYADNPEKAHRVIITGRTITLQSVDEDLVKKLKLIEILPLDSERLQKWLDNWEKSPDTRNNPKFRQFLEDSRCPERIRGTEKEIGLAQEPLLLYLLAAMHRDGQLTIEMFEGTSAIEAKIRVYEKALNWVLSDQRPNNLNQKLTQLKPDNLRRILAEAAVSVVQSGGQSAKISMIEARLNDDESAKIWLHQATQRLQANPLKNALRVFYLQLTPKSTDKVEFAHKSFAEFLCAEHFKQFLEDWSKSESKYGETYYYISNKKMDCQIYNLFGYGGLSSEILEYLMGLLIKSLKSDIESSKLALVLLFKRLKRFYLHWSEGTFIDAPGKKNLPLKTHIALRQHDVDSGLRQVDIYTGLNVMILLLELHRYAQSQPHLKDEINFFPCGQKKDSKDKDTEDFDKQRFHRIISYTDCISNKRFQQVVGKFLDNINLSEADLFGVYLSRTNMRNADLSYADVTRVSFTAAKLMGVNFTEANLSRTNFSGADLENANLSKTILWGTNFFGANLKNITWDKDEMWMNAQCLEKAKNVPKALKQYLGLL